MVSRLIQQGEDVDTVQRLLGHAEPYHARVNLQVSQMRLEAMFESVLKGVSTL